MYMFLLKFILYSPFSGLPIIVTQVVALQVEQLGIIRFSKGISNKTIVIRITIKIITIIILTTKVIMITVTITMLERLLAKEVKFDF